MVDKLECFLELGTTYTKVAQEIRAEVRSGRNSAVPFRKTKDYAAVVDLRQVLKVPALFHIQSRWGKHQDKIELLNTGEQKWDQMMSNLGAVYDGNPEDLPTRRVDLCCDLPDVTVEKIARTIRANYKRVERQYGVILAETTEGQVIDFMQISASKLTGIQLGLRPTPTRAYDKVQETYKRWLQAKREAERTAAKLVANRVQEIGEIPTDNDIVNRGFRKRLKAAGAHMLNFPTFEEWSGLWRWSVLTRVERQFAQKMPLLISNVRALRTNATTFNPFDNLAFTASDANLDVEPGDYTGFEWFVGCKIWETLQSSEMSLQEMHAAFNRGKQGKRSGNTTRIFKRFEPFMRKGSIGDDGSIDISSSELFERYRESVTRQLAA